jgi:hypothetical protein
MKFKLTVSFGISFFLFLISCSSQSVVSQTPIPTATSNLTFTPSPTFSSAQVTETASYARFIEGKQTQEYFMFTEVPATLEARNAKCKDGFYLELPLDIIRYSNEKWTLFTCSPASQNKDDKWTPGVVDYGTRYTQIIKADLSKAWTIQHNTFDYSVIDRPDALMTPYRWTADGKYLYLYPYSYPGGSGFPQSAFLYTLISSLYRINLETGDFELVLRSDQFGALALSPNDQFLAYSEQDKPGIIHIRNMENGNDLQVKLNEKIVAAGAFIWNSENTKVVFSVGYAKQGDNWQDDLSGTSIFVLTPKNMYVQKVSSKDSRIFEPYECSDNNVWLDENTICLYSINPELDSWNKVFAFNIKTGQVVFLHAFP